MRGFRWCAPSGASCTAAGKTTAEAELVGHDGKLYAHASTTCLVFDLPA